MIAKNICKALTFQGEAVLRVDINYPELGQSKNARKFNKFYAETAAAFLKFCEDKLYRRAAESFLLALAGTETETETETEEFEAEFEAFSACMDFEAECVAQEGGEVTQIALVAAVNGEKTRQMHVWDLADLSGGLIRPPKPRRIKKFKKSLDLLHN